MGNIQRFCLDDGPGIRTTVFLAGCNLKCPWCCNPEYRSDNIKEAKVSSAYQPMAFEEILEEIIKDKAFYGDDGGVTFSGGEPLLQSDALVGLLGLIKNEGLNVCIETSLGCELAKLERVVPLIDCFYVDLKIMDYSISRKVVGLDLDSFLKNLKFLSDRSKSIVFRIPVIRGFTDNDSNLEQIESLIISSSPLEIHLLKGHDLGIDKVPSKGNSLSFVPDDDVLAKFYNRLALLGVPMRIMKM